ncbi:MAG: hypothetical protein ACFFC7_27140, partial [Candidatus Hermodarchaeota archaeon]
MEAIFRPKDRFCFLVGSGISCDPPSSLPTGYELMKALVEQLIPKTKQSEILALMNPEREGTEISGNFLCFEQFMQYLKGWDPDLRVLDIYMEYTEPNFNHQFLAQMLLEKHPIFTTNFDNLIESVLLNAGVPQSNIHPVIHREDWETSPDPKYYYVYK